MTPAIRDGDYITLAPLGDMLPGRGDVLAFRYPERSQMLVHRVLRARGNAVFVRGDSCSEADGWVPLGNILGLISLVERRGKACFWPNRSEPHF